jgi:hypothetical protein
MGKIDLIVYNNSMKKNVLFLASIALLLAGCNQNDSTAQISTAQINSSTASEVISTSQKSSRIDLLPYELKDGGEEITTIQERNDLFTNIINEEEFFLGNPLSRSEAKISLIEDGLSIIDESEKHYDVKLSINSDYTLILSNDKTNNQAVANVEFTNFVVELDISDYGIITSDGLTFSVYYYYTETDGARLLFDLSNPEFVPSIVKFYNSFYKFYSSTEEDKLTVEEVNTALGEKRKAYLSIDEVTQNIDNVPEELVSGDILEKYVSKMSNEDASTVLITALSIFPETVKKYSDGEEIVNVGACGKLNKKDVIASATLIGAEKEEIDQINQFDDFAMTFKIMFGNKNGSNGYDVEEFAIRSQGEKDNQFEDFKVDGTRYYNDQVSFTKLTDEEIAEYDINILSVLDIFKEGDNTNP